MQKRNVALLFSMFLVLVGQLFALSGSPPSIYVSTYTGGQILRVNATTGAISVVYTGSSDFLPEDITVGPDNKIYVCDSTNGRIVRMNQNGTSVETVYNQPTGGPQGPRFSATGTLFFNTKGSSPSGVWKIEGLIDPSLGGPFAPVNVLDADQTGEGLAFTNRGDLLIVNRGLGEVQCLQGPLHSCADKITGLTDPIGIAVNSVDEIFVARSSRGDIQRFTPTAKNMSSTYVDFMPANPGDPPDQPFYFEFTSDDTLYVATADAAMQNGKLWKVTPPVSPGGMGTKTLLTTLPKRKGKFPPAVGVGVPATSRSITKEIKPPEVTKVWNFGPHSFELTAGTCKATITARQRPPKDVNDMLTASKINGKGQPLSGEEGWVTTWLVEKDPSVGCDLGADDSYGIAIAAFVDAALNISPGIVRCDGAPTVCEKLPDYGYYPQPGLIPGDPVTSTKSKSFSEYLFVNLTLDQIGNFCGFQSPLISDPKNPNYPAVFNVGKTITFKFQLNTETNCTGSFITDAKAVLSVAQIDPNDTSKFVPMDVKSSGGSNDPPFFRNDNPSKSYVFNLDTTGWTPGLYTATVTSNKVYPQTIQFRLR
jgi:sugar lactone lactonase YvrE